MEPYLLSWIIDGTTWVAASAVVSLFLSLPVSVSALLLFLPVLLSWLYSASSFSPSPHGHRFRRLLIAHRGGRFRPVRKRAGSVSTVSRPLSGVTAASSAAAAVLHPENSLAAFRLASQQPRVGAVELDTWLSADHQPVRPLITHTHFPPPPTPLPHSTTPSPPLTHLGMCVVSDCPARRLSPPHDGRSAASHRLPSSRAGYTAQCTTNPPPPPPPHRRCS